MIKAISFDWFNTLARFEPPRHELYQRAFQQLGIEVQAKDAIRGTLLADCVLYEENARYPIKDRSREEQLEVYLTYPRNILSQAGVEAPRDLHVKVIQTVKGQFDKGNFVLFDDVISGLEALKSRSLILGLLTNATKDAISVYRQLGLEPYLDFVVTSEEAGADKPKPPIFQMALERAGVGASEAAHVGDQYDIDVAGARGVGINPILIDRYDIYPQVEDCPRVCNIPQLAEVV